MKKVFLFLSFFAVLLTAASCRPDEPQPISPEDPETAEETAPSETEAPISEASSGFERVDPLDSSEFPEFVESIWLKEEEEVYYRESAVIAKGHVSNLAEYRIFGERYDYYITAFDFTLEEIYYGEDVSVGDTVSVGNFNSSYEYDSSLPTILENGEYLLFLHSTAENEQVRDLVDYNMPSPMFNCVPVVGDYCEVHDLYSDYGESVKKSRIARGKMTLAYEALKNGEDIALETELVNESYSLLAAEKAEYIENEGVFDVRLSTTYVIRLSEFEETLRRKIEELK